MVPLQVHDIPRRTAKVRSPASAKGRSRPIAKVGLRGET